MDELVKVHPTKKTMQIKILMVAHVLKYNCFYISVFLLKL